MLEFLLSYLAAVNIAAYFLMKIDKQRAKDKAWRIEEALFFSLCLAGGFLGIHLGMQHFRHKTQHWQFKVAVMFSGLLYLVLLPLLFWWRLTH